MTEEEIRNTVKLAEMRDNQAITKLYEEYHNSVYFLCLRIVKDKDEAFDLVQNSFLTAFDKLSSLQKPECFGSWLHQIAANQCKNHLKKRQPLLFSEKQGDESGIPEEFDIEDRDESLIPDQALDTRETRRLLMEIIDGLPDLQRMTVMLYYYEEQSIKEISVIMDCSENTVKSRLNYARKQIKAGVEDLEKKGTKLHGVFPMLFPLIQHAAADTSVSPEASTLMLKHIASSANGVTETNEVSSLKNTPTGPKAPLHERLWSAARNFAGKFSAMSLPVKIGSIAAALAVIAGITVGVVAAVHAGSSTPVSCKVSSQMPSSKPQKRIVSSAPVTAVVSSAVSQVNSTVPVASISLSKTNVSLTVGQSTMPIVTMSPADATDKGEIWTSSDEKVATVDHSGNIKAVGAGSCTVTVASASNPDVKKSVSVTVASKQVAANTPQKTDNNAGKDWTRIDVYATTGDMPYPDNEAVMHSNQLTTISFDQLKDTPDCSGANYLLRFSITQCSAGYLPATGAWYVKSVQISDPSVMKFVTTSERAFCGLAYFQVLKRGTADVTVKGDQGLTKTVTIHIT